MWGARACVHGMLLETQLGSLLQRDDGTVTLVVSISRAPWQAHIQASMWVYIRACVREQGATRLGVVLGAVRASASPVLPVLFC